MAVTSPCVSLCRFDGRTGLCTACLRTLDEARTWKKMGDPARHRILNDRTRREKRLATAASTSARDPK
jgi:predicted Fe-S protein YdhL (DUF1289 family)